MSKSSTSPPGSVHNGPQTPAPKETGADVWADALRHAEANLSSKDIKRVKSIPDYEVFKVSFLPRVEAFRDQSTTYKLLKLLDQPFNHLQSLSTAIGALTQYQGTPACLIWGSMLIIIETCIKFTNTLQRMVEMFSEMTKAMPRFDLYVDLFSSEIHLKYAVRDLYKDYVIFSVSTLRYLRKQPWRMWIAFFWRPVQSEFESTLSKIQQHSLEAERWAAAASYDAQRHREDEAVRRHEEVIRVFPKVVIQSKATREIRSFPVPRNPKFFGRKDVIASIREHLGPREVEKAQDQLRSYTIHGFGGIGKTQTATEYLYQSLSLYQSIFWFRAEDARILRQELADAAEKVGVVPEGQTPDVASSIALFQSWLFETDHKWLIIFDNVDEWDKIKDLWPIGNHGSILLTTRNSELANFTTGHRHLEPYNKTDGHGFLESLLKDSDSSVRAGADALADEIDGYPLALSHVAGYIVTHHTTCRDFLDLFRDLKFARSVNRSSISLSSLPQYEFTLEDVWTMSLKNISPRASEILSVTAFLNPDGIQQDIIESIGESGDVVDEDTEHHTERERARKWRQHLTGTVLRSLTQHTLLNKGRSKQFTIHRLLQRHLLYRLQDNRETLQQYFSMASGLIRRQFPAQHVAEPLTPFWAQCQEILPHVSRLQTVYTETGIEIEGEGFASLLGDAAYYQWEKGLLKEALELCYIARDILERTADEASVHKADVLNVIGAIYIESGAAHINEGTDIMLRVLQIRRNRLGKRTPSDPEYEEDYICVSNALSNLSCCWIGLREWDKAYQAVDEAIQMFTQYCSEESHPYGFAERYANVGQAYAGQGNLEKGIEYAQKATELQRKAFGQTDVRSCVFESYWGNFLIQDGKILEALARHKAALDIRVEKLGPGSNDVAKSLYFVARCHYLLGEYDLSEQMLQEAQNIYSRMYWTENRTARALFLKSLIYLKKGKEDEANAFRQEAEQLRRVLIAVEPHEDDNLELYDQMVFYH